MDNLPDGLSIYDERAPWNQVDPPALCDKCAEWVPVPIVVDGAFTGDDSTTVGWCQEQREYTIPDACETCPYFEWMEKIYEKAIA